MASLLGGEARELPFEVGRAKSWTQLSNQARTLAIVFLSCLNGLLQVQKLALYLSMRGLGTPCELALTCKLHLSGGILASPQHVFRH